MIKLRIIEIYSKIRMAPMYMIQYRTIFGRWKWASFIDCGQNFDRKCDAMDQAKKYLIERYEPSYFLGQSWLVNRRR